MPADRFRLYSEVDLEIVVDDMARQAAALLDATPTVLLGVLRRGAPLADRLLARVRVHAPWAEIERIDLKVKRYADNLELLHPDTALEAPSGADLMNRRVIVVDDVLYQGYSLMRVFEWLATQKPAHVHAAVLVDRQRHRMPVRADIVGVTLKIAPEDVIECNVPPYESDFAVDLWRPAEAPKG
ncbi:bifunctional protein PyrR [Arenimonas soli]|uniref:Bifunctional protein PyrR n=1 Tax=Arenimonas soli TaxID=2269504 RepID=A0ABQ1HKN0_9GAMM|nr:phosphoribosyltransferase family protein [Arenimonas soli]GGA81584.1 bifunctional protein PyrR [Arenimonas soli]